MTSWISAALVKKMEPQKKVTAIHFAELASAASAGTRNIVEPSANRSAIHHNARSDRRHMSVFSEDGNRVDRRAGSVDNP